MKATRLLGPIPILLALLLASCDPLMVYDQYQSMEDGLWGWKDVATFEVPVEDTLTLHNIYLQVRHSTDYPMSNLYMFVNLKGPGGQFRRDTVNLELAASDGRWYGRGNGKLRELRLLYRSHIRFGTPGSYTFYVEQAMRREELPVRDVGLRIEQINQP